MRTRTVLAAALTPGMRLSANGELGEQLTRCIDAAEQEDDQ